MGRARGDPPLSARMARFGASMFAAGALIVAVSGIPPWSTATSRGVLVLVCVCALSAAGLLLLIGPRLPVNAFQVFTLLGTGLITVLGLVGGEGITAYSALYVWASLFAFTFYSFRAALAQVVVIVGAAAALFAMRPATPDRVVHWLLLSGSVVVAGVWVHRLVAQLRARAAQLGETADRLEARERSFRTLFESNPQPMWVYDARTLVLLAVNDAAVAHYGHSRQAFLGMRVSDVTVPEPPPSAPAGVEEAGVSRAAHHRLRDGSVIEVEVASHALEFEGSPGILALVRDVTEQRRTERLRVLQAAVARLLAEATTVEDGAREVLACAGGAIGGEAGTVWLVDGGGERLEPVVGWTAGAAPGDAGARRHDVGRGEGLAGRVWASAAPQATGPPGPDGADPAARSDGAAAPGVGGGIAFPIVNGAEVIGVIELRCRDRCELTTDVRGVMGGIGGQLGQFLARRQAQEALRDSERSFRMLFAVNPHPMWVWDAETYYFLAVNDAAVEHYGYARDEFLAMRVIDLRPPEDVPRFVVESAKVRSDRRHLAGEYRHRVKGGRIIDVEITARLIEFGGRPANLVLVKDITERKELERELRHQAFHDALTGLANRGLFVDRADHVLSRQDRRDPCAAVLLLDLDNFKTVNDSLGHAVGDRLLCAVARRLGEAVRPGDTVARLGGDEFAVLLEDLPADAAAVDLAERILAELRRPFLLGDREVIVGASIGIALSRAGATAERLLRDADVAMYSAKAQGKACCRVFSQSMHTAVTERLAMEQDLRAALHRGELSVVYQPQVEVATGRLVGVEALLRWRRGGQGPVAPDEFVPVAEDIGLIGVLDEWVLAQACGDVRLWQREGLPPLSLAVNISGRELETPGLVDRVHRALETSGLAPTRLELELTESAAVRQSPSALAHLIELRSLGVSIAIDDFGTGYSVLSRLRDFPLDRVKIDKSFIGGVHRATDDAPIVAAMIAMGHGLGLEVVAEGVETPEQLSFLRRHGCDIVQGHLIGRPRPAAELSGLLAVRRSVAAPTERLDLVNVLDAVSEVVSAEPGLDDLCRALLRELARVAGVEVCVHLERSRADATLRVRHAHGVGWGLSREGSTLAAGDPPAASRALGLAAHLAVPVVAGHDSRGWLIAGNRSTRPLAEGLERVMELVAGLIASETEHQLGAAAGVTAAPGLG